MDYQYFYAFWSAIFLVIWAILFWFRKDIRKEMIIISPIFGIFGLITQTTHLTDWWQPKRITNTPIGFEDFFIGFAIGGIAAVIYEFIFRKETVESKIDKKSSYYFLGFFGFLFLSFFYILSLSSGYSVLFTYVISLGILLYQRPHLFYDSIISGIFLLVIGISIYWILMLLYPTYIQRFWHLPDVWYAQLVLGIPLGEYIWYFLTGAFIGPLYEYIEGLKFTDELN